MRTSMENSTTTQFSCNSRQFESLDESVKETIGGISLEVYTKGRKTFIRIELRYADDLAVLLDTYNVSYTR